FNEPAPTEIYTLSLHDALPIYSWRLGSKVTMNYGLRWEYDQPYTDTNDAIVNIDFDWFNSHPPIFVRPGTGDPYEDNPAFRLAPDIQYVRDGRFGRGAYMPDKNDFGPRLGVAWPGNDTPAP